MKMTSREGAGFIEVKVDCLATIRFGTLDEQSRYFFDRKWWRDGTFLHEYPVTVQWIRSCMTASNICDIGANLGWYTFTAAAANAAAQIKAIEMDDFNFRTLRANLSLNDRLNAAGNLQLYQLAVSSTAGLLEYERDRECGSSGFQIFAGNGRSAPGQNVVQVQATTLDDLYAGERLHEADMAIKIDVEGAEHDVISGALRLLSHSRRVSLFIEVHPDKIKAFASSSEALVANLLDLQFKVFEITGMRGTASEGGMRPILAPCDFAVPHALIYAVRE